MASPTGQSSDSFEQNRDFFARETYGANADRLDSHRRIGAALASVVAGSGSVLDVGNGGVFAYDPSSVGEVVAVDLFLDSVDEASYPDNVQLVEGDALALPESLPGMPFDVAVHAFLYHHLAGERAADSITNTRRAIAESAGRLAPGGRLVVAESCIPAWSYPLERALFQPLRLAASIGLTGGHPATLQLPIGVIRSLVAEEFVIERCERIALGRWVTQFGRRWPTALTPVRAHLLVARKPG